MADAQRAFQEAAWGPTLALLRSDARSPVSPNLAHDRAARAAAKERWAALNRALGEAEGAGKAWVVTDPSMREALRDAIAEQLLPLYQAFLAKWRAAPYTGAKPAG